MKNITRRKFLKLSALGLAAVNTFGLFSDETVFAADIKADLVVYGKIFTSKKLSNHSR